MVPPDQLGPYLNGEQEFLQLDSTKNDKRFLLGVQDMLSSWQQVASPSCLLMCADADSPYTAWSQLVTASSHLDLQSSLLSPSGIGCMSPACIACWTIYCGRPTSAVGAGACAPHAVPQDSLPGS